MELTHFIAIYGVWLVAGFIALESVGFPLPAEAALIAAALFAARTHELNVWSLIAVAILAAIAGNGVGFWIGNRFGYRLLTRFGPRLGLTEPRIRMGQQLFLQYGGRFIFIARFLPFLRNLAAVLAGMNRMAPPTFLVASSIAAVAWVVFYALGAYSLGAAFTALATPAAIVLGLAAVAFVVAVPVLFARYEKRFLAKAELDPKNSKPPPQLAS